MSINSAEKSKKKVEVHVHIADSTSVPEHTYVEKIHTPRRSSGVKSCDASEAEWLGVKHAHIDDDAISPSGLVDRVPTPIATPSDRGFSSTAEEVQKELEDDEEMRRLEIKRRHGQSTATFVLGLLVGFGIAYLVNSRRRVK